MKKAKKRILYSNYDLHEMYVDAYNCLKENHAYECPEDEDWEPTDNAIWDEVYFLDGCNWDDFESNFGEFFNSNKFLLQGFVGRWHGRVRGGFIFDSISEMSEAWRDCDYVEIYDENGHLYIRCSHHDGSNFFEIRMLNKMGCQYAESHYYDNDEEVHDKLMKSPYSVLPHCAHKIYGCKKIEYDCI